MQKDLEKIAAEARQEIAAARTSKELTALEIKYLGRKAGALTLFLKRIAGLPLEEKKKIGALANEMKQALGESLNSAREKLDSKETQAAAGASDLDLTLPGERPAIGSMHPNSIVQYELEDMFRSLGFMILDGPELESDYYNFEALNIPAHHPARDTQDTFYIKNQKSKVKSQKLKDKIQEQEKLVLRTHTSSVQVRALQKYGAPLRAVVPGRVFRNEALDASHENTFCQLEGLMVDKNLSVANLIAVMKELLRAIFKKEVKVRLRPGFFPFVEPGFELDISCLICAGSGCSVCKQSGWVELLPCGMVHPNVLKAGNIDPQKFSGFAFGLGLTRLAMLRYGINDIRLMNSGDLRFLKQFI